MKAFDSATCNALSAEISAALAPVAERHGLKLTISGGRYSRGDYSPKISFAVVNGSGIALTPEAQAWCYAERHGLKESDLGATFRHSGREFRILGYRTRAPKRPILCEARDGKQYVFPGEMVARLLAAKQ